MLMFDKIFDSTFDGISPLILCSYNVAIMSVLRTKFNKYATFTYLILVFTWYTEHLQLWLYRSLLQRSLFIKWHVSNFKMKIREYAVELFNSTYINTCTEKASHNNIRFITQFLYKNLMSSLPPFPINVRH